MNRSKKKYRSMLGEIVKIQQSLSGRPAVLIYNRSKTILQQFSDPAICKEVHVLLGDKPKGYFFASIGENGVIHINIRARDREW